MAMNFDWEIDQSRRSHVLAQNVPHTNPQVARATTNDRSNRNFKYEQTTDHILSTQELLDTLTTIKEDSSSLRNNQYSIIQILEDLLAPPILETQDNEIIDRINTQLEMLNQTWHEGPPIDAATTSQPLPDASHHGSSNTEDDSLDLIRSILQRNFPLPRDTTVPAPEPLAGLLDEIILSRPIAPLPETQLPPPVPVIHQPVPRHRRSPSPVLPDYVPIIASPTPFFDIQLGSARPRRNPPRPSHRRGRPPDQGRSRIQPGHQQPQRTETEEEHDAELEHLVREIHGNRLARVDGSFISDAIPDAPEPGPSNAQSSRANVTRIVEFKYPTVVHPARSHTPAETTVSAGVRYRDNSDRHRLVGEPPSRANESPFRPNPSWYRPAQRPSPQPTPVIVQFPSEVVHPILEILQETRATQLMAINQQRKVTEYAAGLNNQLEYDAHHRQLEIRTISTRIDQLASDIHETWTSYS